MKVLLLYNESAKVRDIAEGQLYEVIKTVYGLQEGEYTVQKYDADFNEYVDLEDINSIQDKDKIKIMNYKIQDFVIVTSEAVDNVFLQDTSSSSDNIDVNVKSEIRPINITLPVEDFSSFLKMALQNKEPLSWKLCNELIGHLANFAYKFTPYPNKKQREEICRELVLQYPYLKSPIGDGIGAWEVKMLNKIKKIRLTDNRLEVKVNRLPSTPGMKRKLPTKMCQRKRGINFMVDHVEGEDETSTEVYKKIMKEEFKKSFKNINQSKINFLMDLTYSFRRQWIIKNKISISEIKEEYPFLFEAKQQFEEFRRLQKLSVLDIIRNFLLEKGLKILDYYKVKNPKCQDIQIFNKIYADSATLDEKHIHTSQFALLVLPRLLKETFIESMANEEDTTNEKDKSSPVIKISSGDIVSGTFTIVAEGIKLIETTDFIMAVALLFSFYFTLNLEYPKRLMNSLVFIQSVVFKIKSGKIPPRVITLHRKFNGTL